MKYYKIRGEFLKEITGCLDYQILMPKTPFNQNGVESIRNLGSIIRGFNEKVEPEIPLMEIKKNANLLDVLQSEILVDFYQGITMSNRLTEFITKFNIPKYRLYQLKLVQSKKEINIYKQFVILENGVEYINYNTSEIYKYYHFIKGNDEKMLFKNSSELMNFFHKEVINSNPFFTLKGKKLILVREYNFDIFRFEYIDNGYYISQKLKEAIEESGFTGMRFEEAPNIVRED